MLSGAMAAPLVMAARSFAGFDDSMRLVQAVTQATDADFKALTKTAQRLGRDTSYTAQQAADAMVSLGRMGFSPTEIQASIDAVLNLARVNGGRNLRKRATSPLSVLRDVFCQRR